MLRPFPISQSRTLYNCNDSLRMILLLPFRLLVLLAAIATVVSGLFVRTPATQAYFKTYSQGKNVVQNDSGCWFRPEQESTAELAKANFAILRANLPKDFNPVQAGGWHALQQASADPKGLLMEIIRQQVTGTETESASTCTPELLNSLVALLRAQNKGFDSDLVDGEWTLVFQQQGQNSPTFQKLIDKKEKAGMTDANFDVDKLELSATVKLFKGLGVLKSTVQYKPVADNFDSVKNSNKVVLRRIACDITGASWKFWKLPTIPLPLKKKGGYLDFVYLDQEVRVTTGNRGGLFVHARPACVQQLLQGS